MVSTAVSQPKIPTKIPQLRLVGDARPARMGEQTRSGRSAARVGGDTRMATRGDDRVVVEVGAWTGSSPHSIMTCLLRRRC